MIGWNYCCHSSSSLTIPLNNKILHEILHFLMFGRKATLPVDVILGVPTHDASPAVPLRIFNLRMRLHGGIYKSAQKTSEIEREGNVSVFSAR